MPKPNFITVMTAFLALSLLSGTALAERPANPFGGTAPGNPPQPGVPEDDDFGEPSNLPPPTQPSMPPPSPVTPPPPPTSMNPSFPRSTSQPPGPRTLPPANSIVKGSAQPVPSEKPAPKLADYLELDNSLKGLEVKNFDLPDKEIKDVVTLISKWTGKNFILDSKVRGKITIMGPSQVTLQEAYQAFLSALDANGLTTTQSGKFIRIIESAEARRSPVKIYTGEFAPNDDQFITVILQLKYINADEVQKEFRDLTTRQGKLFAYEPTNSLIVTDTGSNIQRIREILKALDVKSFETTLHVLKIKNSSAKTISEMLDQIYSEGKGTTAQRSFRKSALERTRGGGVITKILPDEQTNSLVVLANDAGMESLRKLVDKLDVKSTDTGRIHVYYCEYAKAEDLASTLQSLAGGGGGGKSTKPKTSTTPTGGIGGAPSTSSSTGSSGPVSAELENGVKVTADPPTNSLVVIANASDYKTLKKVLKKLDIPRLQVFVETAILELSLSKQNNWTPNMGLLGAGGKLAGGLILDPTSAGQIISAGQNGIGTAGYPIGLTFPYALTNGQVHVNIPGAGVQQADLVGFINWIKINNETTTLSTPQIVALDNEKATFKVEDTIPVLSGVAQTFGTTPTIPGQPSLPPPVNLDNKKVGINIELTPHVNASTRNIRLEIKQSVSNVNLGLKNEVPGGIASFSVPTTERSTETQLVAKDNDFIMLGGLITDTVQEEIDKVPILGDIPLIGWFFKKLQSSKLKSNLLLIMQPHIIGTTTEAANSVQEGLDKRTKVKEENLTIDDAAEDYIEALRKKLGSQKERGKTEKKYEYKNKDEDNSDETEEKKEKPGEQSEFLKKDKEGPVPLADDKKEPTLVTPTPPTPSPSEDTGDLEKLVQ